MHESKIATLTVKVKAGWSRIKNHLFCEFPGWFAWFSLQILCLNNKTYFLFASDNNSPCFKGKSYEIRSLTLISIKSMKHYGKFHRFLFPFSNKFPDLNLSPYVSYITCCARIGVIDPGGGGTSKKIGWGCSSRFLKPLPYLTPKSVIFLTLFQTWSKV